MFSSRHRFFTARFLTPSVAPRAYHQAMQLFEAVATAFFRTFGITQPSDQARRRAAWFLFGTLTLIVIGIFAIAGILIHIL
jgi:hypothetical protein